MGSNREEYLEELEDENRRIQDRILDGELLCAPRLEITKIVVLTRECGTDLVWLHTTMPSSMPAVTKEPLTLQFEVVAGGAVDYIRKNFGLVNIEVINERNGQRTVRPSEGR